MSLNKAKSNSKLDDGSTYLLRVKYATRTKHEQGNTLTIGCRTEAEAKDFQNLIAEGIDTTQPSVTLRAGTGYDILINCRNVDWAIIEPRYPNVSV